VLAGGIATDLTGLASSLPSGLETPDASLALRKGDSVAGMDTAPQPLYRVLETRKAEVGSGTLLGTDHVYVVPGAEGGGGGRKAGKR
jgi:splicing factor 3B subunit 2